MTNYAKLRQDPDQGKRILALVCDINRIRLHISCNQVEIVRDLFNELAPLVQDQEVLRSLRISLIQYANGQPQKAVTRLQVLIAALARKIPPVPGFRHPLHCQN